MAAGDVFSLIPTSVAAGATYDVQPSAGVEAVIHNLYWPQSTNSIQLYWKDGTNTILFDSETVAGGRFNAHYHVTNAKWLGIKNTTAGAVLVAYDGVQTK